MPSNTYVILGMPPSLEKQKEIGKRVNQVSGVEYTGGSTEGFITVEMGRQNIADVRRALGPGFENVSIITYRQYQIHHHPFRSKYAGSM